MSATRDMVREFHEAFGVVDGVRPHVPLPQSESRWTLTSGLQNLQEALDKFRSVASRDVRAHRLALITEELTELVTASIDRNTESSLDALCDLQYVLDGTVLAYGMDGVADEAFRRVHASNMSKLGADGKPVLNATGKVCKGPNYVPVQLGDLVR